ncbi:MAG: hypothetical protein U0132_08370 [Gemmatimonadaceae bacterium]
MRALHYSVLARITTITVVAAACSDRPTTAPSFATPLIAVAGMSVQQYATPELIPPLAPPGPGNYARGNRAAAINSSGHVVGTSTANCWGGSEKTTAYLYYGPGTAPIDLFAPDASCTFSVAMDINNYDGVAGTYGNHAFRWTPSSGVTVLPGLLSGTSEAYAINNAGAIVGSAYLSLGGGVGTMHAVQWTASNVVLDIHPAGYVSSVAVDINDSGVITGIACNASNVCWVGRWSSAGFATLSNFVTYWDARNDVSINNYSTIAASHSVQNGRWDTSYLTWNSRDVVYSYPAPPAAVLKVSDKGRVVGVTPVGRSPFPPAPTASTRLGNAATVLPITAGYTMSEAAGVNTCGDIVGTEKWVYATGYGQSQALIWRNSACDP